VGTSVFARFREFLDPIRNVAIRDYFGTVCHLGCHIRKSSTWNAYTDFTLGRLPTTSNQTRTYRFPLNLPSSNYIIYPTPPNTNLIPVSDCSPHLTFGGPEPPKSHNQAIICLPMAIARQACKTPMRCDAAHPTPHPLRLNAGPHGIGKHILPI
jgi:hypothetical protein